MGNQMGKELTDGGITEIQNLLPCVQQRIPGAGPRLVLGYVCLLFFAKRVCQHAPLLMIDAA